MGPIENRPGRRFHRGPTGSADLEPEYVELYRRTEASLKRILQTRNQTKMDGLAQRLIPKPALLRQRLQQTGRTWTLAQYGLVSLGIIAVVSVSSL